MVVAGSITVITERRRSGARHGVVHALAQVNAIAFAEYSWPVTLWSPSSWSSSPPRSASPAANRGGGGPRRVRQHVLVALVEEVRTCASLRRATHHQ